MRDNPVRIAVFGSGSMSSLRFCLENDAHHSRLYRFVGVFSDMPKCTGVEYAEKAGIPALAIDFKAWCRKRGVNRKDLEERESFFAEVLQKIAPWNAEAIMLSGFMLLVTNPLLSAFNGRILNVHPALLNIPDEFGERKYRGLRVVERAMKAGDATGSTVHIVTGEPDAGPIVAESDPLPYGWDDSPEEHQDRMKTACDGPAFITAFKRLIDAGWPNVPWQPV